MLLTRGWRGLLVFWIGVLSLCGAGAAALQVLGPANRPEAAVKPPAPSPIQLASLVPLASSSAGPVSAPTLEPPDALVKATAQPDDLGSAPPAGAVSFPAVEASRQATEAAPPPVAEAAPEPTVIAATEPAQTASAQSTNQQAPEPTAVASIQPTDQQAPETTTLAAIQPITPQAAATHPVIAAFGDGDGVRRDLSAPRRTVLLRVARDPKACPTAPCLRWHVVQRHAKSPRASSLDFARLRLAPGLRQAAEGGGIELYIDATEEHRTVKGRESIVYVATSLVGVTPPHDKSP